MGVIRISGKEAISIAEKIFKPRGATPLSQRKGQSVVFGDVYDEQGRLLDEVLLTLMRGPHSYTGEDTVELSCHGGTYILRRVLRRGRSL